MKLHATRFPLFLSSHVGIAFVLGHGPEKDVLVYQNGEIDFIVRPGILGGKGLLFLRLKKNKPKGHIFIQHKTRADDKLINVLTKEMFEKHTSGQDNKGLELFVCEFNPLDWIIIHDDKVNYRIDFACFDEKDIKAKERITSIVKEVATITKPVLAWVDYTTNLGSIILSTTVRMALKFYQKELMQISNETCFEGFYWCKAIFLETMLEELGVDICEVYAHSKEAMDEFVDIYEETRDRLAMVFKYRFPFLSPKIMFDYHFNRKKIAVTKVLSQLKRQILG